MTTVLAPARLRPDDVVRLGGGRAADPAAARGPLRPGHRDRDRGHGVGGRHLGLRRGPRWTAGWPRSAPTCSRSGPGRGSSARTPSCRSRASAMIGGSVRSPTSRRSARLPDAKVYRSDQVPTGPDRGPGRLRGPARPARRPSAPGWPPAPGSTRPPTATRPSCSGARRRNGWASAGRRPDPGAGRRRVVHRGGHPGPVDLAPELDSAALIGWPAAQTYLGFDGHPTTVYTRSRGARGRGGPGGARRDGQPGSARTR